MANNNSPHILNTSATLLGLCFIVITSRNILDMKEGSMIDELTGGAIFFFTISCFLSFLSLRNTKENNRYERWADFSFFLGLMLLFLTTLLITLNII